MPEAQNPVQIDDQYSLGQIIPMSRMQKIIAKRMLQSKLEIPCFYLNVKVDMTAVVEQRAARNQSGSIKLSYNDFIMKAVAISLLKFPLMTGQIAGDVLKLADSIDIGLAIEIRDGLVAPIIKNVEKKTLEQIAADSRELIEKARSKRLSLSELEGGCTTVSSLGPMGISTYTPIVMPGQCSVFGIGGIMDVCVSGNGGTTTRKMMSITLSVDHKIANGAYAARFLDFVKRRLEDPASLTN